MRKAAFFIAAQRGEGDEALAARAHFAKRALAAHPALRRIELRAHCDLFADPTRTTTVAGRWGRLHLIGTAHPEGALDGLRHAAGPNDAVAVARWLTRSLWGDYVACIESADDVLVLRDPSGATPLHVVTGDELVVAGAGFDHSLATAAGFEPRPSLTAIVHVLARPPAASHLELLTGMSSVAPGEAVSLVTGERHTIWSPAAIAARARSPGADELVATLDATIAALTPEGRVGVELSGGFDSSVVFSSLARSGRSCIPFNFATRGGGGDERRFARSMAKRWEVPLAEYGAADAFPDYRPLDAARQGVVPIFQGLDSVFARARDRMIEEHNVSAVMTGQGGDCLFFQLPTRLVAVDRFRAIGLAGLRPRLLIDDAIRVQGSFWSVGATALGYRHEDDAAVLPALTPHLLGEAGRAALLHPAADHPWYRDAIDLPPAKHRHLMTLVHALLFHGERLFAPAVPLIHPLLAQPLVELMLATPAYDLASGPLDRGFARAALGGRLSDEVRDRRSKGEASDHYARAVLHNRDWLLALLLDGTLAGAGLVDRDAVERALRVDAIALGTDYRAMAIYAAVETWLRHWHR